MNALDTIDVTLDDLIDAHEYERDCKIAEREAATRLQRDEAAADLARDLRAALPVSLYERLGLIYACDDAQLGAAATCQYRDHVISIWRLRDASGQWALSSRVAGNRRHLPVNYAFAREFTSTLLEMLSGIRREDALGQVSA